MAPFTPKEVSNARTGILASSVRTIPIASVQFFVPRNSHLIDVKTEGLNACEFEPSHGKYRWSGSKDCESDSTSSTSWFEIHSEYPVVTGVGD